MKVTKRDFEWLRHFAEGGRDRPKGMGPQGVSNFVSRKWIVRVDREMPFGPELYRLEPEGMAAYQRMRSAR